MDVILWCFFGLVLFSFLKAIFGAERNSCDNSYHYQGPVRETRRERRNRNRRLAHQRRLENYNRPNSRENEDIHCHVLIDREEKAALILMHRENSNEALGLILMHKENSNNFRQNGMKELTYRK